MSWRWADASKQSPFTMFEMAMGSRQQELGRVPESQPFCLHALALTAKLVQVLQDPDWGVIENVPDAYSSGVSTSRRRVSRRFPNPSAKPASLTSRRKNGPDTTMHQL